MTALLLLLSAAQVDAPRVLDAGRHHLRSADEPEWEEFAGRPDGRQLTVRKAYPLASCNPKG